jgi:hypothetical protein
MIGVLDFGEGADFLKEASCVYCEGLELYFCVLAEADVAMVPAEVVIVVGVVVAQDLARFLVVVLESVEPAARMTSSAP